MRFGGFSRFAAMASAIATVGMSVVTATPPPAASHNPRRRRRQIADVVYGGYRSRRWNKYAVAHHGNQERERRARQITAGSLRVENGLVAS